MKSHLASGLLTLIAFAGCNRSDMTGPMVRQGPARSSASVLANETEARSGDLAVTKDCGNYRGNAGDICTITQSSLRAIPAGSTITYATAAVNGILNSDVIVDPPGPGANVASGHCMVSLITGFGNCQLSGGTGEFQYLHATVAVSPLGGLTFAWRGTYSYGR